MAVNRLQDGDAEDTAHHHQAGEHHGKTGNDGDFHGGDSTPFRRQAVAHLEDAAARHQEQHVDVRLERFHDHRRQRPLRFLDDRT